MSTLEDLSRALERGERDRVKTLTELALEEGLGPRAILDGSLVKTMEELGIRFSNCDIFLPELMAAATAMHAAMGVLKPRMEGSDIRPVGKVVMGTIKGDMHDIGKNLVGMMLRGAGFEIIDLGVNVPAEKFIASAKEHESELIGISALLTTTMQEMGRVVGVIKDSEIGSRVKVMVGGAPLDQAYADKIGADGYGKDGGMAVERAKKLMGL